MKRLHNFLCTVGILAGLSTGCDLDPLEVENPTAIQDADLNNAEGAELLRVWALDRLNAGGHASYPRNVGLLSDEFFADSDLAYYLSISSSNPLEDIDRRNSEITADMFPISGNASNLHTARNTATLAIERLRAGGGPAAHVGQMFAVRGLAKLLVADAFCPGQAFNEYVDQQIIFTPSLTTTEAYASALQDLDSAVVHAVDSARILHFAQVVRARALLELGRFEEAAIAAASVPTDFTLNAEFGGSRSHPLADITAGLRDPISVADREGGNGIDFVSADDPRVPTEARRIAFDGVTELHDLLKYGSTQAPIPIASGLEARLIEAEAALEAGSGGWLDILNELRANQITPALAELTDPGAPAARVDLVFRERAFWLFATGRRLADLRRLVRLYGRTVEETFPWGEHRLGGTYSSVTTFAISERELRNPAVTGCTDR